MNNTSFIKNVNELREKLPTIENINNKFDAEALAYLYSVSLIGTQIKELSLIKNPIVSVDTNKVNINTLALIETQIKELALIKNPIVSVDTNKVNINTLALIEIQIKELTLIKNTLISVDDNKININAVNDNKTNINIIKDNILALQSIFDNITAIKSAEENAKITIAKAKESVDAKNAIINLDPSIVMLASNQNPNVDYNSSTGSFILNIPQALKGDRGEAFNIHATGIIANRVNYDGNDKGFAFLSLDEDPTLVYFKISDTVGDWSVGIPFGRGATGKSIQTVTRTVGDGTAGTQDTYTITLDDENVVGTFIVTNGAIPTKADLLLDQVNNTSDLNKSLSTAAINALALKSNLTYVDSELGKKLNNSSIKNELTSTDIASPLSANMGLVLKGLIDNINTIILSDDTTLDEMQEVVNFIKQNKSTLDTLAISNIAGLETALSGKSPTAHNHDTTYAKLSGLSTQKFKVATATEDDEAVNKAQLDSFTTKPTIIGTATFTNSTNSILLTGIGSLTGLEVGDVLKVTNSASNNTEFTVEVITDANNVIVNQAHAGGTTTKSLINETTTAGVTVEILAKWYNASIGLGRGWVDVTSSRALGVAETNITNRAFSVLVNSNSGTTSGLEAYVDGNAIGWTYGSHPTGTFRVSMSFNNEKDKSYSVNVLYAGTLYTWKEYR